MESDLITQERQLKHSEEDLDAEFDQHNVDVEEILARTQRSFSSRSRRHVALYEAPEFVKRLNAFEEVTAGDTVVFECQWRAFPKPTIKWYKDDQEITEDARYDTEADNANEGIVRLLLNGAKKSDEGAYKCKAENQEGVASTTGYLSVSGGASLEEKTLAAKQKKQKKEQKKLQQKQQEQQQADGDKSSSPDSIRKVQSDSKVSYPPHLRTIVEQKSLEEREAESVENQPPSPIQEFIEKMQSGRGRGATWPYSVLGYGNEQKDEDAQSNSSDTSVESQVDFDSVTFNTTADDDDVFTSSDPDELQQDTQANGQVASLNQEPIKNQTKSITATTPTQAFAANQNSISQQTVTATVPTTTPTSSSASQLQNSPSRGSTVRPIICANAPKIPDIKITATNSETVEVSPTHARSDYGISRSNDKRKSTEKENSRAIDINLRKANLKPLSSCMVDFVDSPWVYFMPLISSMTFYASATEMSPLMLVLIMTLISCVAFHVLLHGRSSKKAHYEDN